MNQASLRLWSADDPPMPITSNPTRADIHLTSESAGQLIGELSVHREAFSRSWTGSQTALECVLDAIIPDDPEPQTYAMELEPLSTFHHERSYPHQNLPPVHESLHGLTLHQGARTPAL